MDESFWSYLMAKPWWRIFSRLTDLENAVSELDDVTSRLETDEAAVEARLTADEAQAATDRQTIADLQAEIAALGSSGADVARLKDVADKLEARLAAPTP